MQELDEDDEDEDEELEPDIEASDLMEKEELWNRLHIAQAVEYSSFGEKTGCENANIWLFQLIRYNCTCDVKNVFSTSETNLVARDL